MRVAIYDHFPNVVIRRIAQLIAVRVIVDWTIGNCYNVLWWSANNQSVLQLRVAIEVINCCKYYILCNYNIVIPGVIDF